MVTMKRFPLGTLLGSPRRHRVAAAIAIAAATGLALSGCQVYGVGAPAEPDPVGFWGTADTAGLPFLAFTEDGKVAGSDGCNQLTGAWEVEGSTIDFIDVASTLMACEGVDTWLSALDSATISGETMTIMDNADKEIGTLKFVE
ncbi:heat shock protein HslJ [Microterricola gilva]|uniref:Heat shock protein HslJ n=2 Tax=Microterricola gilva TaxID=393267 RepID=A0A4Q8AS57_9MICO|nr:heat shock protein HslJ [Microterricola gilva]